MAFNKIILAGNLVADPELKTTTSGISVVSFRIGVQRKYSKGQDAQTDFFNVTAWRQTAEFIARFFTKGKAILVCGELQNRKYQKDGQDRYVTEIVASEATFCGSKNDNNAAVPAEAPQYLPPSDPNSGFEDIGDEALPW